MEKVIRSNNDLGAAIRLAGKTSDLRQVNVAQAASVRQDLVSHIENGATAVRLDTLTRILAGLSKRAEMIGARVE